MAPDVLLFVLVHALLETQGLGCGANLAKPRHGKRTPFVELSDDADEESLCKEQSDNAVY